jgi:hypothetical protein
MKYVDADKLIKNNMEILLSTNPALTTPHNILGWIIAPEKFSVKQLWELLEKIELGQESNEAIVAKLPAYFMEELDAFVFIKIWGKDIVIPLQRYLDSPLLNESDFGNDS